MPKYILTQRTTEEHTESRIAGFLIVMRNPLTLEMLSFPNAKINIGLNITSRRSDGYHNLETVFYPVKVKDALEVIEANELTFTSSGLDIPGTTESNLCLKAYHLISADYKLPPVHIHLHKHIPIGAGLGGGSADAAFFIRLLNDQFQIGLGITQMEQYARQLGADCAFFLHNKPVYGFGKGDEFEEIQLDLSAYYLVLLKPDVHISTAEAYRGVVPKLPLCSLRDAVSTPPAEWRSSIRNDFEASVFKNHPFLRGIKAGLYEAGALYASMSGSGSSIYGIFNTEPDLAAFERDCQVFRNV